MTSSLLLVSGILLTAGSAQPVVVGEHGSPDLDACLSVGRIVAGSFTYISLRMAPTASAVALAEVENGTLVHLCSSSEDGKWHGVVVESESGVDCGVASPVEKETAYNGPCISGWIEVEAIEVIGG